MHNCTLLRFIANMSLHLSSYLHYLSYRAAAVELIAITPFIIIIPIVDE
jgi:hypothetical protein